MDVFNLRDRLIEEYRQHVSGFVAVKEPRVRQMVEEYFDQEYLWPEPLVQLNSAFKPGRWVHEMVAQKGLHPECTTVFRRREHAPAATDPRPSMRLRNGQERGRIDDHWGSPRSS